MADRVGFFSGKRNCYSVGVADINFVQRHTGGQVRPGSAREIIEHSDLMAGGQQGVDDVAANEAGTAGDEDFHGGTKHPGGGESVQETDRSRIACRASRCLAVRRNCRFENLLPLGQFQIVLDHHADERSKTCAGLPAELRVGFG